MQRKRESENANLLAKQKKFVQIKNERKAAQDALKTAKNLREQLEKEEIIATKKEKMQLAIEKKEEALRKAKENVRKAKI